MRMRVYSLIVFVLSLLLNGCSSSGSRAVEQPITVEAATIKSAGTAVMKPIPSPTVMEAEAIVARLFRGDVAVAGGRKPMVLVGDFNGDSSTDLAVAVKPNPAKLTEVTATRANRTVQDPHRSYVAPKDKSVVVLPPIGK